VRTLEPIGVTRETGRIVIGCSGQFHVRIAETSNLGQIERQGVKVPASTETLCELLSAYRYTARPWSLDVLIDRTQPRLVVSGRTAVAITSEVAAALTAAHGQEPPIVHRDLKPENLMLTPSGVKVMDFGIGKVLQAMRKGTTGSVGTLAYMSPEQIDAAPIDHRADLYALGLVLYEMLAGRPPFQSESPRQLLEMQCTAPPPPLPDEARAGLPRGGPSVLITTLGVFRFVEGEAVLVSYHSGASAERIAAETGWPLRVAVDVQETPAPTADELRAIREYDPSGFWTRRAA
jgi:serine/threonine protein kinase